MSAVGLYRGGFLDWGDRRVWVLAPPRAAAYPIPAGQLVQGELGSCHRRDPREAAGRCSRRRSPSRTTCGSASASRCPRRTPPCFRVAALSTNLAWPLRRDRRQCGATTRARGAAPTRAPTRSRSSPASRPRRRARGFSMRWGPTPRWSRKPPPSGCRPTTRPRASPLAPVADRHAGADRRGAGDGGCDGLDDLAAAAAARLHQAPGLQARRAVASAAVRERAAAGRRLLAGSAFGIYGQLLLSHALASVTGFPIVFSIGGVAAVTSFALVSAAAVAILALPGYLAVRVRPTTVSIGLASRVTIPTRVTERPADAASTSTPLRDPIRRPARSHTRPPSRRGSSARWRVPPPASCCGDCARSRARCAAGARGPRASPTRRCAPMRSRSLSSKRASTDGAALFWTLPDGRSPNLLRLLVAFEVMADFLDNVSERGVQAGPANGIQLHVALSEALDPGRADVGSTIATTPGARTAATCERSWGPAVSAARDFPTMDMCARGRSTRPPSLGCWASTTSPILSCAIPRCGSGHGARRAAGRSLPGLSPPRPPAAG